MKKKILIVISFLLFLFGMTALILSLVGVKLSFLLWIDAGGPLLGFIIRLVMIFGGITMAWLTTHNWEAEDEENDPYITRQNKY